MNMDSYIRDFYASRDNYKVIDTPEAHEPDLCCVYFSSIGLFTEKNYQTRLDADYYEFHRNRCRRAGRHIFVRDVTRAVYLSGISARHDTIEKLLTLLQELTKGYRVITLGVSGGGYMAMLAGAALKAEYVLSISGVVHLDHVQAYFDALPDWIGWNTPEKKHWFNIVENIKDCGVEIFQFDAAANPQDMENARLMQAIPTVRPISVNYRHHAGEVDPPAVGRLVNMTHQELRQMTDRFSGRTISKFALNFYLLPWRTLLSFYAARWRKNLLKLKFGKKGSLIVLLGIPLYNSTGNPE